MDDKNAENRAEYTEHAAEAADAAWIDYTTLQDVGFDHTDSMSILIAWHGRSITGVADD